MKKILIIIATMMSLSIHAEGEGRHAMHAFYFMNVTNPIAVVGALDEFAASECGKRCQRILALWPSQLMAPMHQLILLAFLLSLWKISPKPEL